MEDSRGTGPGARAARAMASGFRSSLRTVWFLLRIVIPVSFAVAVLDWLGALSTAAGWLRPVMGFLGLPGEAALVFISSVFLNNYSAIAVASSLSLDLRAATILALMCLTAHNLIVETAVMRRAGSSAAKMAILRIGAALLAALLLNLLLPRSLAALPFSTGAMASHSPFPGMLAAWGLSTARLALKIVAIVIAIMAIQSLLEELRVMDTLSRVLGPAMGLFGLPRHASFLWIVINVVGYAYGAGIIERQVGTGTMEAREADLFNHHAALCHSLFEDTALYLAVGIPLVWITVPRLALALLAVWIERARRRLLPPDFPLRSGRAHTRGATGP